MEDGLAALLEVLEAEEDELAKAEEEETRSVAEDGLTGDEVTKLEEAVAETEASLELAMLLLLAATEEVPDPVDDVETIATLELMLLRLVAPTEGTAELWLEVAAEEGTAVP